MQQMMSESVQAAVRPHECENQYYADKRNSKVSCLPSTVENRFVVTLPSPAGGSTSTVVFNPDGLITDICLTAQLNAPLVPAAGLAAGAGLGVTRGWLYQLVDRITVRYAGSSLYQFGGEQELIQILSECEDSVKRDNMLVLGGAEIATPTDWADADLRTGSIYIKLPHNSPSAQEKPLGFPTSEISAPVQIQVTFKPFANILLANAVAGANPATLAQVQASAPTGFSIAEMQFKQAHLNDRGDSVSAKKDLSTMALSLPLKNFMQSQFETTLPDGSSRHQINLTGFRSGSVQGIMVWAVRESDINVAGVGSRQPLRYLPLREVELAVNGLVYFRAARNSSQLWDLVERKTACQFSTTSLAWDNTNSVYIPSGMAGYWVWIPFAQGNEVLRDQSMLSNGLGIANSVVNLTVDTGVSGAKVKLFASYLYNSTILISGGSCDYTF